MDCQQTLEGLKGELERFRTLWEQECASHMAFHEEIYKDAVLGEILRLRREVKGRIAHEKDLLSALAETQEQMAILQRTSDGLLDEPEEEVAVLKSK